MQAYASSLGGARLSYCCVDDAFNHYGLDRKESLFFIIITGPGWSLKNVATMCELLRVRKDIFKLRTVFSHLTNVHRHTLFAIRDMVNFT